MKLFWIFVVLYSQSVIDMAMSAIVVDGSDPGSCDKYNHAEEFLVRDRKNNEKVIICTENDGVYQWKAIDGSSPPGEFFSPGYDCSDLLDKDMDAKDGFYWVHFDSGTPKKVWCDMTTDGGGFMLIGHKNNSVTWSVPSNDDEVEPFANPHWSSALGDSPILDFRIQMSSANDFKQTKAHWSFRLNDKRPLKSLMIMGEKGCDNASPGIGDIAYVKDLQTENIVTTTFLCSNFGTAHHPLTQLGWSMMNSCLQKPCPRGFAYHHLYPIQLDYSGAFSYSTIGQISGINNNATAFIGCNLGHCCGCYGPVGGTDDYCTQQCQAINGGTVTTNTFTWFWVRSTLPKRVWNKCMEYKVTKDDGDVVWNKLVGDNVIPAEGRCIQNEVLLNDGIAVVPDESIAKKIPSVPGLLAYRKDRKELYVRSNKTWNVIPQEKKIVAMLSAKFEELEDQLSGVNQSLQNHIAFDQLPSSIILQREQNYILQLKQWLPVSFSSPWTLCYRASKDGWASSTFHSLCDYKGPTVTIVLVGNYVFGGYSDNSWGGFIRFILSTNSFIFSLKNYYGVSPFKASVYQNSGNAIYTDHSYGPTFGGGHDFCISDNANSNSNSYTEFGHTYQPPSGYSYQSSNTRTLLTGSYYNFSPSEVEVFYLR